MKLNMAQMHMEPDMDRNLETALKYAEDSRDADFLFFPEIMLSPFFPQYSGRNPEQYLLERDDIRIMKMARAALRYNLYISPNVYLSLHGKTYDASLMIGRNGSLEGISTMVHIFEAPQFYEEEYYTPSPDGFHVYETELGKIGIVICFDRHIPESVQTCAAMGADLVIIPTANCREEPMDLFEAEIRTQAMQNGVFIAMCNRVGREGKMDFAGESLVAGPDGRVIVKADDREQLVSCEIDLSEAAQARKTRPYLKLRRPEFYA